MKASLDQFTIVETQPFSELHKIVCDLFMLLYIFAALTNEVKAHRSIILFCLRQNTLLYININSSYAIALVH